MARRRLIKILSSHEGVNLTAWIATQFVSPFPEGAEVIEEKGHEASLEGPLSAALTAVTT